MNFLKKRKNGTGTGTVINYRNKLQHEIACNIENFNKNRLNEFKNLILESFAVNTNNEIDFYHDEYQLEKSLIERFIDIEASKGGYVLKRHDYLFSHSSAISCLFQKIPEKAKNVLNETLDIVSNVYSNDLGYEIELKTNKDGFGVDIEINWGNAVKGIALINKRVADEFNELPEMRDDVPLNSNVDLSEKVDEIVSELEKYLLRVSENYGTVPRNYTYEFEKMAESSFENSVYKSTMEKVIEKLPKEFIFVKGNLIKNSKNAIKRFTLEFVYEI